MDTDETSEMWPEGRKPLSLEWISDSLLLNTQDVWSKYLGRPVSQDEAVEMINDVRALALVFCETRSIA